MAQADTDHRALVASVKADLVARGVQLEGPCGAFEITHRVAWALRFTGARLVEKTSGNNCRAFAVDLVGFSDGSYVDMLIDSGGANEPTWNVKPDQLDLGKLVTPFDPGDAAPAPAPAPTDPRDNTPPPAPDPAESERFVAALERIYDGMAGIAEGQLELSRTLKLLAEKGVRIHL